jgi:amino acid transporter
VPERTTTSSDPEVEERFRSLLEGLRTTLPGVQVLFAFLLAIPFQSRFRDLSNIQEVVYYIAFVTAAVASVLLIAPSVHQRMRAPVDGVARRSYRHLMTAVYLSIAGTVVFGLALVASAYLVTSLVYDEVIATIGVALIAMLLAWTWLYMPLIAFSRDNESRDRRRR